MDLSTEFQIYEEKKKKKTELKKQTRNLKK